jgi:hypothetical protein
VQWSFYVPLGVIFAVCAFATALAAGYRQPAKASAARAASALTAALLWWRVDLVSNNSAGDLWIWLIAGLLLGLAATATGRRSAGDVDGERVLWLVTAAAAAVAVAVVALHSLGQRGPQLSLDAVVARAGTTFTASSTMFQGASTDGLRLPLSASGGFRPVGGTHFALGTRGVASAVFARDDERIAYTLVGGTDDLSYDASRTEDVVVNGERRTLSWINDGLMTFEREDRAVIVSATPASPELAGVMRELATAL